MASITSYDAQAPAEHMVVLTEGDRMSFRLDQPRSPSERINPAFETLY